MLALKNKIILILLILILGLTYYLAIYKATDEKISLINSEISTVKTEIDAQNLNLENINNMADEIIEGKESGSMVYDYDNMASELAFLSSVVKDTSDYNISFEDPVCEDDTYVRRNVTITFICSNYFVARDIISDITNCPYRTIFNNVLIVPANTSDEKNPSLSTGSKVSVQADLTFIELFTGNDAGLTMKGVDNENTLSK